jgi:hypothetical protein
MLKQASVRFVLPVWCSCPQIFALRGLIAEPATEELQKVLYIMLKMQKVFSYISKSTTHSNLNMYLACLSSACRVVQQQHSAGGVRRASPQPTFATSCAAATPRQAVGTWL